MTMNLSLKQKQQKAEKLKELKRNLFTAPVLPELDIRKKLVLVAQIFFETPVEEWFLDAVEENERLKSVLRKMTDGNLFEKITPASYALACNLLAHQALENKEPK